MWENLIPLVLPAFWWNARSRLQVTAGVWILYLSGAHEQPSAILRVYSQLSLWAALAIWGAHALWLTLPWAATWPKHPSEPRLRSGMMALTLGMGCLPPWGGIGWLHPLTVSGWLFPGWGNWGLASTFLCLTAGAGWGWKIPALGLIVALGANAVYVPHQLPHTWLGVDTHLGKAPGSLALRLERQQMLMNLLKKQLTPTFDFRLTPAPGPIDLRSSSSKSELPLKPILPEGNTEPGLLVLPETAAGFWGPAESYWWQDFFGALGIRRDSLLLGAAIPAEGGITHNGAWLVDESGTRWIEASYGLPDLDWGKTLSQRLGFAQRAPWSDGLAAQPHAQLQPAGLIRLQNHWVLLSFCFEDFLVLPQLIAVLGANRPEVIVSLSNHWWADGLREPRVQKLALAGWARLWGAALVSADNLPIPEGTIRAEAKPSSLRD